MAKKTKGAKPYRRGVGIALIDKRGRVFVGRRIDAKVAWQMPQGGIDKGESPRAAAKRELREETGVDKARIIAATPGWLRYELPERLLKKKTWGGKYRGQEQKWYLMRFTGADRDIDLTTHKPEFSKWKWLPFRQLPRVIVGFKREIYKQVVAEFAARVAELKKTGVRNNKAKPKARRKKAAPKRRAKK